MNSTQKLLQLLKQKLKDKDLLDLQSSNTFDLLEEKLKIDTNHSKDFKRSPLPHPPELANYKEKIFFAIYSDGACRHNPGPGSWAVMAQNEKGDLIFESTGVEPHTTNNRMELLGALSGLKTLENLREKEEIKHLGQIFLFSDSRYVVDGMTRWRFAWKKRGWRKADGKVPENLDLWKQMDEFAKNRTSLVFFWVKGHNDHPQNEYCDRMANTALDEAGY